MGVLEKASLLQQDNVMTKAKYVWCILENIIVIMEDHDGLSMSVTNDMENVIKEIYQTEKGLPETVIYKDTEGIWDQVICKDGEFVDFKHLGAPSMVEAIKEVLCQEK